MYYLILLFCISETPTAKARWVLEYLNFQYITNDIKTNLFLQDFH